MPTEIRRDEVCQMVAGGAALVEVLPAEEYEAEHLPGAINIPLQQLDRQITAVLQQDQPVIVYCYDFIAAGSAGKPRYTELSVCWPLLKPRHDAWYMRGGPLLACREPSSQTSDSRPISHKLPAPSLRRPSHRRSSVAPIPHVTLRQSHRQPRPDIRTSGSTKSGQTRPGFSSSTPARFCPSSINSCRTARRAANGNPVPQSGRPLPAMRRSSHPSNCRKFQQPEE